VLFSYHYSTGAGGNFATLDASGNIAAYSDVAGEPDEVYMTVVRDGIPITQGGWSLGDVFYGHGAGGIGRIPFNGGNPPANSGAANWVTLTGATGYLRGGLYIDRTGSWGGDMVAATDAGEVYRIKSNGQQTHLANVGEFTEGIAICPNDPSTFGDLAGKILVGDEENGDLITIDQSGVVTTYAGFANALDPGTGSSIENIRWVEPNSNLYAVDYGNQRIAAVPWNPYVSQYNNRLLYNTEVDGAGKTHLYTIDWDFTSQQPVSREIPKAAGSDEIGQNEGFNLAGAGVLTIHDVTGCPGCSTVQTQDITTQVCQNLPVTTTASSSGTCVSLQIVSNPC